MKAFIFGVIAACLILALFTAILAVWGAVSGDGVWRTITTLILIGATAAVFSGVYTAFFPQTKEAEPKS